MLKLIQFLLNLKGKPEVSRSKSPLRTIIQDRTSIRETRIRPQWDKVTRTTTMEGDADYFQKKKGIR